MSVTSTNIRLPPGVYLAMKHIAEDSSVSIGNVAGFFILTTMVQSKTVEKLPKELQTAVVADALTLLGEIMKSASISEMKDTNLANLYKSLLYPSSSKEE